MGITNKPIFCIVGKSGAGKSTYLDRITSYYPLNGIGLRNLKYHTTRKKRTEDEDDYYYTTNEDFYNTPEEEIIEYRKYSKYDEDVIYYTTKSDVEDSDAEFFVCAASVDQVISYIEKLDNIYIIEIEVPLKERITRLLDRCNNDIEIMEVCRRTLEEEKEYSRIANIDMEDKLVISNYSNQFNSKSDIILANTNIIVQYIKDHII